MRRAELAVAAAGVACLAGVAGVVLAAHEAGDAAGSPLVPPGNWPTFLRVTLIGAFVAYALGCWLASRTRSGLVVAAVVAAGVQLVPLAGPLLLSTDAGSYTSYGRAHQPYHLQDGWATPSVYGPLWTFVSEPIAHLGKPLLGFRVLAALSGLAIAAGAAWLAVNHVAAVVLVGWNPLLALHLAGGGHNDALMIAAVVLALVLERTGRTELAGAAWAASIWIKWVSVVFWALWLVQRLRRRRPVGLLGFATVSILLVAASFARFGTGWLHLFSAGAGEARRPSSLGLPHWLGHLGLPHREGLALSGIVLLLVLVALGLAAWRGRLRLGRAGSLVALAQGRLNPWYGVWGIGLAGTDDDALGRVLAVAVTGLLLFDAFPR